MLEMTRMTSQKKKYYLILRKLRQINGPNIFMVGVYSYLGYNVTVLPGVSIGNYCVIGSGSVVTRDVPGNSITAGNPSRELRSHTEDKKRFDA